LLATDHPEFIDDHDGSRPQFLLLVLPQSFPPCEASGLFDASVSCEIRSLKALQTSGDDPITLVVPVLHRILQHEAFPRAGGSFDDNKVSAFTERPDCLLLV
jgi:hypothetical protein